MSQDNALTPRSFGGPSNDTEYVNTGSFLGMTQEERHAKARREQAAQCGRRRGFLPVSRKDFCSHWVDDDFDEMGF